MDEESSLDLIAMGRRIRERRMKMHITQEKLAELANVSPSFIGHIERGEKKSSLETMSSLARSLASSLDYLVLGVENRCDQQSCQLYESLQKTMDVFRG